MRRAVGVALAVLALMTGACGETTQVREPDVVVSGAPGPAQPGRTPVPDDGRVRIRMVTHAQASDAFWKIVRNGAEAAARQADVAIGYQSPDIYSVERMRQLINAAVDTRPDGLVVSIPSRDLVPAIRRAVNAGIPVVSINSGSDLYERLGVLAHVGQPEERAGYEAGRRLASAGVRSALCVNHEVGNVGLRERCEGLRRALAERGGSSFVVGIDTDERLRSQQRLRAALTARRADGLLALGSGGAEIAMQTVRARPGFHMGSFDLSPQILDALKRRRLDFAVDQQAYLQGFLPVTFLAQLARNGLFPAEGELVPTGPRFVTRETADETLRLSRQGIR
jgi:simple sugar transport system substrate-binding protein